MNRQQSTFRWMAYLSAVLTGVMVHAGLTEPDLFVGAALACVVTIVLESGAQSLS